NWLLPFLPPRRVTYNQGSYCSPNGTYKVMPGFPYNNTSESNLRFTIGVDDEEGHNSGFLGQMEIDYVKAWQRENIMDGDWEDICDIPDPIISGPSTMCGYAVYSVSSNFSGGTWSSNNGSVAIGTPNSTSTNVFQNGLSPYNNTVLTYTYKSPEGCTKYAHKTIYNTGTPTAHVMTSRNRFFSKQDFSLWVTQPDPNATY